MGPYFVLRHPPICEDAHKNIERIVSEGSAVIGKGRRARRIVRQNIWKQCPCDPLRLGRRISTRMLQSVREGGKKPLIVPRFPREVGTSVLDKQDSLRRPRSALRLDPAAAMAWHKRARPQAKLCRPQSSVGYFKSDAADVFVGEEIVTRELQVVLRAFHVAEERVATPAGKEAVITCLCHPRLPPC